MWLPRDPDTGNSEGSTAKDKPKTQKKWLEELLIEPEREPIEMEEKIRQVWINIEEPAKSPILLFFGL